MNELVPAPDIAVIIVTYNSAEVIGRCLDSVADQGTLKIETWVVDNQSGDPTVELICRRYPWVKLQANKENLGFGRANNQVLGQISAPYVFLLNPDAYFYPGALDRALDYLRNHPEVGMAGARILYPDGTGQDSVSDRYPNEKFVGKLFRELPGMIAALQGSALIISTALLRELQGFDPDYFLYGEDIDLCMRVRQKNYCLALMEHVLVGHQQGHTEKTTGLEKMWERKLQAEYLFYQKHYPQGAILRIARAQCFKSGWSLFLYGLNSFFRTFRPASPKQLFSQAKYRAIWNQSRAFLRSAPNPR